MENPTTSALSRSAYSPPIAAKFTSIKYNAHETTQGAQPNSQAWVNGYPHTAWLSLNQYFARAFRDGTYPKIERDRIFMWARPHPRDADAKEAVPRPDNWQLVRGSPFTGGCFY